MTPSPLGIAGTLASRWWHENIVDRYRLWSVRADGVEVTQAIQHYRAARHLTDPDDRGRDNSVQLVANKAAWVRVYVRSGLLSSVSGVTGTLQVERRRFGPFYDSVTTISPQPPGNVTARQTMDYATERGSVWNTLNFVIPATNFQGTMRLTVRLTDAAGAEHDTRTLIVEATLWQTLRVRAILVSYNGPSTSAMPGPGQPPPPNIQLAAPTLADLQTTAGFALRAMPVEATGNFASAGILAWNLPLDDPRTGAGGCSANWNQLLIALANQRTNDGNRGDVVYYGLLPAGIPLNVPGCGSAGLGSAAVGNWNTFLHEIGHGYGFGHTPCGAVGTPDPNYPTYEPYPAASIGEYGLDISNGNVFSPQMTRDYMSYCPPRWMSLYQHERLLGHARLNPRWIVDERPILDYFPEIPDPVFPDPPLPDPPPFRWRRVEDMKENPMVAITGIVQSSKEIEVTMVARVAAAATPPGTPTRLTAELIGDAGDSVARGQVHRLDMYGGCGCGGGEGGDPSAPPYAFQAYVPDVEAGAALRIMDGDEEVWSRRAPERPPQIEYIEVGVTDDQLELSWHAEAEKEEPEAWAQWSGDRGETWHGLATGLTGQMAAVGFAGLPEGEVLVRILVHDGFYTATSEPASVQVPVRAPEASILHPAEGQTFYAGRTLHLWAAATDAAGEPLADGSCRWMLDDREVARGKEAWLETPSAGEHQATLVVRSPEGEVVRSVRFRTIGTAPRQPRT